MGQSYVKLSRMDTSDAEILFGKPAIRGTRIPVELVLDELSVGMTIEEAIYAALAFAADTIRAEVVYPLDQALS